MRWVIILLLVIMAGCMFIKDSTIDNSNLFREDISGSKETGIDLDGANHQQVSTCDKKE